MSEHNTAHTTANQQPNTLHISPACVRCCHRRLATAAAAAGAWWPRLACCAAAAADDAVAATAGRTVGEQEARMRQRRCQVTTTQHNVHATGERDVFVGGWRMCVSDDTTEWLYLSQLFAPPNTQQTTHLLPPLLLPPGHQSEAPQTAPAACPTPAPAHQLASACYQPHDSCHRTTQHQQHHQHCRRQQQQQKMVFAWEGRGGERGAERSRRVSSSSTRRYSSSHAVQEQHRRQALRLTCCRVHTAPPKHAVQHSPTQVHTHTHLACGSQAATGTASCCGPGCG